MTALWFDAQLPMKKYAAIVCVPFKAKHPFDKIAGYISQTGARFGVENEALKTCTVIGSDTLESFAEFGRNNK